MIDGFTAFAEYLDDEECDWLLMELKVKKAGAVNTTSLWRIEVIAEDALGTVGDWTAEDKHIGVAFNLIIEAMQVDA